MSNEIKKSKMNWGKGILISIILFFLINIIVIVFAFNEKVDLVTKNYYEKEIKYQEEIDKQNNSSILEQNIDVNYNQREVIIKFPINFRMNLIEGNIHFYRPSDSQNDFLVDLKLDSLGFQRINTSGIKPGAWKIIFNWKYLDKEFLESRELFIE